MIKLAILLLFGAVGFAGISSTRLAPGHWSSPISLVAGGVIVFLAYEGFELIANSAEDVADPGHTLPQAYYISVLFVIALYVLVAVVSVGSVPVAELVHARDYALAVAARPTLGSTGFKMIAVAAMLSTASAINATLYGTGRLSDTIARKRELPEALEHPIWNRPLAGLFITAGATLALANVLNLASISTMGSAGFLIIFGVVNAAEARTSNERGSRAWISVVAALACGSALIALVAKSSLGADGFLGAMVVAAFAIEAGSCLLTGRIANDAAPVQRRGSEGAWTWNIRSDSGVCEIGYQPAVVARTVSGCPLSQTRIGMVIEMRMTHQRALGSPSEHPWGARGAFVAGERIERHDALAVDHCGRGWDWHPPRAVRCGRLVRRHPGVVVARCAGTDRHCVSVTGNNPGCPLGRSAVRS